MVDCEGGAGDIVLLPQDEILDAVGEVGSCLRLGYEFLSSTRVYLLEPNLLQHLQALFFRSGLKIGHERVDMLGMEARPECQ